jgi:TolA-binding protein
MNSRKNPSLLFASRSVTLAASLLTSLTSIGCASIQSRNASESTENSYSPHEDGINPSDAKVFTPLSPAQKDERIQSLESTVLGLNSKIQELEGRLQAARERPQLESHERQSNDAKGAGSRVSPSIAANDPESGFVNDVNVRAFRQSKFLLDQEKYPEAILALSSFIERNPKHPLAGSAQFWIAESYYHQGDLTVAAQEYRKVLSDYPLSSRVSYALARLSSCEASLGRVAEAGRFRTQFDGLFPSSPAASLLGQAKAPPTPPAPTLPRSEIPTAEVPTAAAPTVEIPTTAPSFGDYSTDLDGPPSTEGR